MATFIEQSDAVLGIVNNRKTQADAQLALTNNAITAVRGAITSAANELVANAVSISTTGVDTTFVPASASAPSVPSAPALPTAPSLPTPPVIEDAPDLPTVPTTPTAPTIGSAPSLPTSPSLPSAPTIPPASDIAISDALWNAAYLRGQGLQDRIKTKNLAQATNRAAFLGHDEWSETQAVLTAEANDGGDEESSKNSLSSSLDQARALREDVINLLNQTLTLYAEQAKQEIENFSVLADEQLKRYTGEGELNVRVYESEGNTESSIFKTIAETQAETYSIEKRTKADIYTAQAQQEISLYQTTASETRQRYVAEWSMLIDNYKAQWDAKTSSETARLGYERLELDKVTDPERVRAEYDLKKVEIANQNAVGELMDLVQVYAQLTNGLFQTSDVSLGSSVSIGLTGDA